jgi:uncharacterized membrane protein
MQKMRQILAVTTVLVGCTAGVDVARADSFLLSPGGQLEPLDTPAGYRYSGTRALNDAGIAVGFSGGNGWDRATVWNGSSTTLLESLPGYQSSAGTDINSLGQVLGLSDCPVGSIGCGDRIHATLWTNGLTIDIGVPMGFEMSVPIAINDSGQVLLRADTQRSNGSKFKAFLWYGGSFS